MRLHTRRVTGAAAITAGLLVLTLSPGAAAASTEPVVPVDAPPTSPSTAPADAPSIAAEATATTPGPVAAPEPEPAAPAPTAAPSAADLAPEAAPTLHAAAAGTPAVSVTPTTGLNPAGGSTLAVAGTGFDATANNGFGVYAVIGPVDPGNYFKDANRFLAAVWLHPGGRSSGSPGQGELSADGSFSTTLPPGGGLPLTAQYTDGNGQPVNCLTTQCYVVTMAAHGVPDRSQDTCTPISFAGGTAVASVDQRCQPVTTPTGTPTGASGNGGNTTGGNQTTGAGGNDSTTASSSLPRTGSSTGPLMITGGLLVLGGLVLCGSNSGRRLVPVRVLRPVTLAMFTASQGRRSQGRRTKAQWVSASRTRTP